MILVFISWIYSFFILLGMGILGIQVFRIKTQNLFYILLSGMFLEILLLYLTLIFLPTNLPFYIGNFLLSACIIYQDRKFTVDLWKKLKTQFEQWNWIFKSLGFLFTFSVLAKSSSIPYLIDNESYYIQTIKWLNEYGFVKGLANLHIYFGQMSGWHMLQSAFNFGFLSDRLNDLNGFLMFIFGIYSLNHLHLYLKSKDFLNLFMAMTLCGNLLFFQFISTPSPDLPIFLISQVIFYIFILNFKNYRGDFGLLLILCTMLVLIKITSFLLLFFPFVLLIKHDLFRKKWHFLLLISAFSLILFIVKNYIITGFFLYPLDFFSSAINPDWKIPSDLQQLYVEITNNSGWKHIDTKKLIHYNFSQKLYVWIFQNRGIELLFNLLFLSILFIFPFSIKKKNAMWFIWGIAILNLTILLATSPQYRFFLNFIIGIGILIFARIFLHQTKLVMSFVILSILVTTMSLFFNFNLVTSSHQPQTFNNVQLNQSFFPHKNSRYQLKFKQIKEGNVIYTTPEDGHDFFWGSFDGDLPSVNEKMINYIKKKYKIRPQIRTGNLKDGFYSEKIE